MLRATGRDVAKIGRRTIGLGAALAAIVFPSACRACGAHAAGAWSPMLCGVCGAGFPLHDAAVRVPPPLGGGHAYARFEAAARILLIDLKYAGVLHAGRVIGRRMARAQGAGRLLAEADVVVPVPLHWRRHWRRGHNQAAVLAKALCRSRGLPLVSALRRHRATRPQVDLERAARRANVGGAFHARGRYRDRFVGASVLLVDDVVTTGATAAEAAYALRRAGAASVRLYAAACAGALEGAAATPAAVAGPSSGQPLDGQAPRQRKPAAVGAGGSGLVGRPAGNSGWL